MGHAQARPKRRWWQECNRPGSSPAVRSGKKHQFNETKNFPSSFVFFFIVDTAEPW